MGRRRDLAVVSAGQPPPYDEVDPFDLPEWLGVSEVTWEADRGLATGHRVAGALTAPGQESVPCDLLAVDDAYPAPIAADPVRVRAHQLWRHGEVLVASDAGDLLLVVPGSRLDTETVLEAIGRLARAVGAPAGTYAVRLRVGDGG
jgi:hypothetical protein